MKGQRPDMDELELFAIAFRGADNDGAEEDQQQEDEDKDDTEGGAGSEDKDSKENEDGKDKSEGTVSREDFARLEARMKAADKARQAAQDKVKEFEDKDKSAIELAESKAAEAETKAKALEDELNQARIQNAFFSSNKHTWANPATALRLADLSEVAIGEDGKVTGLDKALDALAKSDPYLLKKDDEDEDEKPARTAPGGTPPKGDKNKARREELKKKYPALRGRG